MTSIAPALRRLVSERALHRCEYCCIPDDATLVPHEPDHIVGEQHGGKSSAGNLAYACFRCNRFKGPNIATRDPKTGQIVPLFNPRADQWSLHFRLNGVRIVPLTASARGTLLLLRFNDEERVGLRRELLRQGRIAIPPNW